MKQKKVTHPMLAVWYTAGHAAICQPALLSSCRCNTTDDLSTQLQLTLNPSKLQILHSTRYSHCASPAARYMLLATLHISITHLVCRVEKQRSFEMYAAHRCSAQMPTQCLPLSWLHATTQTSTSTGLYTGPQQQQQHTLSCTADSPQHSCSCTLLSSAVAAAGRHGSMLCCAASPAAAVCCSLTHDAALLQPLMASRSSTA